MIELTDKQKKGQAILIERLVEATNAGTLKWSSPQPGSDDADSVLAFETKGPNGECITIKVYSENVFSLYLRQKSDSGDTLWLDDDAGVGLDVLVGSVVNTVAPESTLPVWVQGLLKSL